MSLLKAATSLSDTFYFDFVFCNATAALFWRCRYCISIHCFYAVVCLWSLLFDIWTFSVICCLSLLYIFGIFLGFFRSHTRHLITFFRVFNVTAVLKRRVIIRCNNVLSCHFYIVFTFVKFECHCSDFVTVTEVDNFNYLSNITQLKV